MKTKIKVIAPSSGARNIQNVLDTAKEKLAQENIELIYRADLFSNPELAFFAASAKIRQNDLIEAITSKECDITWAVRGGYGSANLIEECLKIEPSTAKTLIGFSDITALHVLFNQYYNLPTIHGSVITSYMRNHEKFSIFAELLNGEEKIYELTPINDICAQSIEAKVCGGNLTILTTLIGTKIHPIFKGKILLIEDVDEKGYKVYRDLMHLKQAGCLDGCKAIIFADFASSDENIIPVIEYFSKTQVSVPCYRTYNIGHGDINHPIVFGAPSRIRENELVVSSPFNYSKEN